MAIVRLTTRFSHRSGIIVEQEATWCHSRACLQAAHKKETSVGIWQGQLAAATGHKSLELETCIFLDSLSKLHKNLICIIDNFACENVFHFQQSWFI